MNEMVDTAEGAKAETDRNAISDSGIEGRNNLYGSIQEPSAI